MFRPRIAGLLLLLLTACGGSDGEAGAGPVVPLPDLAGPPAPASAPAPAPEIEGLVRTPDIEDGIPRIEHRLPSGALITLVQISAVPELEPYPTGFHLEIGSDGQPRLTAIEWGGGPPPPALGEVPAASDEEALAAWGALSKVPASAVVALYLDEEVTLGQAEPVFELLARRGVQTVVWGFAGSSPDSGR